MPGYPNSPYPGSVGGYHQDEYSFSNEGDLAMGCDESSSMPGVDISTININDILGIATTMINNQGGMDIN